MSRMDPIALVAVVACMSCAPRSIAPCDAGVEVAPDVPLQCPAVEESAGEVVRCDPLGLNHCRFWASRFIDSGTAYGSCQQYGMLCIRGVCPYSSSGTCHCGEGPPCGQYEVCFAQNPTTTPHCICAMPP